MGKSRSFLEAYGLPIYVYPMVVVLIILFATCTEYEEAQGGAPITTATVNGKPVYAREVSNTKFDNPIMTYPMYMDAIAMCAMGFGFLYVFSKYYAWSGVGYNFFICGFCFLWIAIVSCFVNSMWKGEFVKTKINIETMIDSNLVTAAVLISFGAFYGFISPTQLVIICIIEPFIMKINEHIIFHEFHVQDAGGSLVTHAFGAYFGIAVAVGMKVKPSKLKPEYRTTQYLNDMGAMIGTIVLWIFWPSFNGALLYNDTRLQGRVVMNTYIAICGSCVTAFATSTAANKGRLEMIEIQNATLAGGVIIGMISSFLIDPWVALIIGAIGGTISSLGYSKLHPLLEKFGITDSAAVQMLHGIPGLLGTIFAAFAVLADNANFAYSYDTQWISTLNVKHSRGQQFGYIVASLILTLVMSIVTGVLTGLLVNLPIFPRLKHDEMLIDHDHWHVHGSDPRKKRYSSHAKDVVEVKVNDTAH